MLGCRSSAIVYVRGGLPEEEVHRIERHSTIPAIRIGLRHRLPLLVHLHDVVPRNSGGRP